MTSWYPVDLRNVERGILWLVIKVATHAVKIKESRRFSGLKFECPRADNIFIGAFASGII